MIGSASVVTSRDTSCAYTNVYEKLPSVYAIYAFMVCRILAMLNLFSPSALHR